MSLSLLQTPATCSLAQSPIVFSIYESTNVKTSGSFQYIMDLYYWQGSTTGSASVADYTLAKFPNNEGAGLFEVSRIINSTLTQLAIQYTSSVEYFAGDFYWQYKVGTAYVTGSHLRTPTFKALDGYGIFQEAIGAQINTLTPYWPLMTDGPATQSAFIENTGNAAVYVGNVGTTQPTKITYVSNLGTADYTITGSTATTGQIIQYPIGPSQSGFPLSTTNLQWYSVRPFSSTTALGKAITYNIECLQKYPNVRIKWKNRFGQFDYFNFYMVNRQSFSTEKRTYSPQLGTWEASTLSYNKYDSSTLNYVADSKQAISVNTFWISEDYNDLLKQLLVSAEIYWVYDEANDFVRPLTIASQNITFKTGVVDKLIQYAFDFNFGQAYKLII
jgi:hypothetical protein